MAGSGSGRRGMRRRSTTAHFRKSRKPGLPADGQGFLNPPSGRWWLGIDIYLGKSARYGRGKILLEMCSRLHADESGHDRQRLSECDGSASIGLESGKRGVNLGGEGSSEL